MRGWPWILLVLLLPAASACRMGADTEGQWGLWSTTTGTVQPVRSPMFHHDTACVPWAPGHALAGDLFVWAEPVWGNTSAGRVHVHKDGAETAVWPVPHRGAWREVEHLGVADGVAYLLWETDEENGTGSIGRLDLVTGHHTELENPYPRTNPYWLRMTGSILWNVAYDFGDANQDAVWSYDLAVGQPVLEGLTAQQLGFPASMSPVLGAQGNGWVVFGEPLLDEPAVYWAKELATGTKRTFTLPQHIDDASSGGRYLYALVEGTLHRVDLGSDAVTVTTVEAPHGFGHRIGAFGPQLGMAQADVLVLSRFDSPYGRFTEGPATHSSPAALGMVLVALGLACQRRKDERRPSKE